jgi:DNA-binding beta-propeller fold protein YncE
LAFFQGGAGYKLETRYPVPGNGGFDYVTIDSAARRLYLSHGTQVDVIDPDTGKLIGTIGDTPGVHGVAIAPEFKHGFTSNGRENKVSMFDPTTLQLINKIDVGKAGQTASTTIPEPSVCSPTIMEPTTFLPSMQKAGRSSGLWMLKAMGNQLSLLMALSM